jgi:simple sugar transport system permease protein
MKGNLSSTIDSSIQGLQAWFRPPRVVRDAIARYGGILAFGMLGAILTIDITLIGGLLALIIVPIALTVTPFFFGYLSASSGLATDTVSDVRQGAVHGALTAVLSVVIAIIFLGVLDQLNLMKLAVDLNVLTIVGLIIVTGTCAWSGAAGGITAARYPLWGRRVMRFMRQNALQLGIIGVTIALWDIFVFGAPSVFLRTNIYQAFMTSTPYWGVIAMPLTMVIIAGEIDLSFTSIMAVGMVGFWEVYSWTNSLGVAMGGALLAGFLVGLLNGIIVVQLGIPSLIATIGTQFFWRGVVQVVRNGQGQSLIVTQGSVLREMLVGRVQITSGFYIPAQTLWMISVALVAWILLNRHKFGAHTYLIGDNEASARLMGVNVDRTRMLLFALVGVAAAFGGVISSVQVRYFWTNLGEGYLLNTLAAVFLGGTYVFGGTGTILGTFVACFIIAAIPPGIIAIGLTDYWTNLINGLAITAAVAMHAMIRRRME